MREGDARELYNRTGWRTVSVVITLEQTMDFFMLLLFVQQWGGEQMCLSAGARAACPGYITQNNKFSLTLRRRRVLNSTADESNSPPADHTTEVSQACRRPLHHNHSNGHARALMAAGKQTYNSNGFLVGK